MFFYAKIYTKARGGSSYMKKYTEEYLENMNEIYKLIMKRCIDGQEIRAFDIVFLKEYYKVISKINKKPLIEQLSTTANSIKDLLKNILPGDHEQENSLDDEEDIDNV